MNCWFAGVVVRLAAFALAAVGLSATASAAPTEVFTALLVQVDGQPADTVVVSADTNKNPTSRVDLTVDLGGVPPGAILQTCVLRLSLVAGTTQGENSNGILVQLRDMPGNAQIGARTIDYRTNVNEAVTLQSKALCGRLQDALRSKQPARLELLTNTRNGQVSFYGAPTGVSSASPRLLLTYELPDSWPGNGDWTQPRGDAQQTGRSAWKTSFPWGAAGGFSIRDIGPVDGSVTPPILLHDRQLLAITDNVAELKILDRDGKSLGPVRGLPVKPDFMAMTRQGWFYGINKAGAAVALQLGTGVQFQFDIKSALLAEPTVGDDGSLYVVTTGNVYAYPPPGPQPRNPSLPLWRYGTGATTNDNVSAAALSRDGRTVYVVDGTNKTLIALDAATGAKKWERAGLDISRGANEPMPVPVVAGNTVFVTSHAPAGDVLYVVTSKSAARADLQTVAGRNITAPVVGPDGSVYIIDSNILRRGRNFQAGVIAVDNVGGEGCRNLAGFDLLRGDESGDLYGLDRTGGRGIYVQAGENSVPTGPCRPTDITQLGASLAIAADGTAYNRSLQGTLQALDPVVVEGEDRVSLTNQSLPFRWTLPLTPDGSALLSRVNNTTFRGRKSVDAENLLLPANTNITIVAGERVAFGPGVRVAKGAQLRVRVGQ